MNMDISYNLMIDQMIASRFRASTPVPSLELALFPTAERASRYISFNEKGQNDKLKDSAIQNRGGKLVTVAPKVAANAKVQWPMLAYDKRR